MATSQDSAGFYKLADIIAHLRGPDGCPWDRRQTHRSLREHLLAECYEVLEALDAEDAPRLGEELGDLFLQIMLHARIAEEAGEFDIADIIGKLSDKLVYRHPHIFGDARVSSAEEVAHNWEDLKKASRGDGESMLRGVPREMPSLGYAHEVQKRVARVGFDWDDDAGVLDKLAEEVAELARCENARDEEREFGDILFTLVNVARRRGIDAEAALRGTNRRFSRRFAHMEEICRERGLKMSDLSLTELDALWEEAKSALG